MKDLTGKPQHLVKADSQSSLKLQKDKKTRKVMALMVDTTKTEDKITSDRLIDSSVKPNKPSQPSGNNQKKTFIRAGDWICQRCNNHNFSFRVNCNMCHLSHELSEMMLSIYRTQRMKNYPEQAQFKNMSN